MDRRILRTHRNLQEALIDLIIEKSYEAVTVQDVLDRAGVARSTFYAHYRDKEALLKGSIDNLHAAIERHWRSLELPLGGFGFVHPFLAHVGASRHVYLALIGGESGPIVERHFRRMLADLFRADLGSKASDVDAEVRVQFLVGALTALTFWWMDYEIALTPAEVNARFLKLAMHS